MITPAELRQVLDHGDVLVVDVRLQEDFDAGADMIPGAVHHDARRLDTWADSLCAWAADNATVFGAKRISQAEWMALLTGETPPVVSLEEPDAK